MHPAGLFCTNLKKAVDNSPFSWYNNTRRQERHGLWGISSAGRALAWHARGQRFDPAILHHTVRTRTRFFTRKGSGTFFVYRKFCGRTTQSVKRAKAGYHYDGGILPFALRNQVRFVRTWSSPYMTHWGQSLCTCVPGERVHLWQGVTH